PGGRVVGTALLLVLSADRRLKFLFLYRRPGLALGLDVVATNLAQNHGGLLAAHHRNPCVRPHPEKARTIGASAHAVIASAVGTADHNGEFRHAGGGHRRHQLGAIARDTAGLVLFAHHEAGDVLEKHKRDIALTAQLDEMRTLQRVLAEQDAVVGDDADRIAPDMRKAADKRLAVEFLEFVKLGTIDQPRNDVTDVEGFASV